MNSVIGEILPLAIAVAISPIPVIAAVLMLLSPRARVTSVAFLLGWILGVAVVVTLFTLLSGVLPQSEDGPSVVASVIKIVLGALLLLLAIGQWRKRPRGDETPAMPKWMSAIDSMTGVRAGLLGLALSAVNPKNLLMALTAGLAIGSAGLSAGEETIVIVIFVVLAVVTVAVPVIGYLVASDRLRQPLDDVRVWLTANNAVVMAVLLAVIGVVTIGKGIAGL